MARTYARIKVDIWNDDGFRALSPTAQHLYLVLLTDPQLSYCGVADWRPKRIAGKAEAWTPESVEMGAHELIQRHLLIVCEDTEEALVRSFMRHDGVLQNAKLAVSAANAVSAVASNGLRGILAHELNRLAKEHKDWAAWKAAPIQSALKKDQIDPRDADLFGPDFAPALGRIWAMPENAFGADS